MHRNGKVQLCRRKFFPKVSLETRILRAQSQKESVDHSYPACHSLSQWVEDSHTSLHVACLTCPWRNGASYTGTERALGYVCGGSQKQVSNTREQDKSALVEFCPALRNKEFDIDVPACILKA